MTGLFARDLDARIKSLDLPMEARAQLEAQTNRLASISIPEQINQETQQAVRRAVEESFVSGFRVVMLIAAGLALTSGLFAWLLIEGREQRADSVGDKRATEL